MMQLFGFTPSPWAQNPLLWSNFFTFFVLFWLVIHDFSKIIAKSFLSLNSYSRSLRTLGRYLTVPGAYPRNPAKIAEPIIFAGAQICPLKRKSLIIRSEIRIKFGCLSFYSDSSYFTVMAQLLSFDFIRDNGEHSNALVT